MRILVRTVGGKTFNLFVDSSETIRSIKAKIQERECIHPDKQYLISDGKYLEDGHTLSDIGIKDEARIDLGLHIFVNTGGKSLTLKVASSDTIGDLKAKINEKLGFKAEHRLVFGNKPLEAHKTLLEYGIHNEATLHMVVRVEGGMQIFVETLMGKVQDKGGILLGVQDSSN